ncbi:MAG: hypothetical protein OQK82_00045 [Candidatus Pacearchaeota archaeon]|nr:hypothetical protein [Candidatus Pacearchaeota archaeon]
MHEYSISHHDRKTAYYFLAILSGLLGAFVAYILGTFESSFGIAVAAPSGLAVFGFFFLLFDRFIWQLPWLYTLGIIKIPNLNGQWDAAIVSSATGNEIQAQVYVHQTYSKIRIRLETEKSESLSQMAALEMADPTLFNLRYEYSAEYQRDKNAEILRHYGVASLKLKSRNHEFSSEHSATYYTEQGRDSHGTITVRRSVK